MRARSIRLVSISIVVKCQVRVHCPILVTEVFERRRKYGIPVRMSRHPEIVQYIMDVVRSIHCWLKKGSAQKVVLALGEAKSLTASLSDVTSPASSLSPSRGPNICERFIFDIDFCGDEAMTEQEYNEATHIFKGAMLKVTMCQATLATNPKGLTWHVLMYTLDKPGPDDDALRSWVLADVSRQPQWELDGLPGADRLITPIKGIETSHFRLDVLVEENLPLKSAIASAAAMASQLSLPFHDSQATLPAVPFPGASLGYDHPPYTSSSLSDAPPPVAPSGSHSRGQTAASPSPRADPSPPPRSRHGTTEPFASDASPRLGASDDDVLRFDFDASMRQHHSSAGRAPHSPSRAYGFESSFR